MLRASFVVGQFRFWQWLIVIERQFVRLIKLLGIFVGEQFIGQLRQQCLIGKFIGTIQQHAIQQRFIRQRASKLRDHL